MRAGRGGLGVQQPQAGVVADGGDKRAGMEDLVVAEARRERAGVGLQLAWAAAPRWLSAPSYAALGLIAVFVLPDLLRHGGPAAVALLCAGGAVYLLGAVAYAARWPNEGASPDDAKDRDRQRGR